MAARKKAAAKKPAKKAQKEENKTLSSVVEMDNRAIKVPDAVFFSILRENGGLFARTARAIKKQTGIEISRQAVRVRAQNHPEILEDIEEENIDVAEEGLHTLMRSKNERVKLDAVKTFLKTKGKKRGYVEKTESELTVKDPDALKRLFGLDED